MGIADEIVRVERQSRDSIEAQAEKLQELTDRVAALERSIADVKMAIAAVSASREISELFQRIAAVEQQILGAGTRLKTSNTAPDAC